MKNAQALLSAASAKRITTMQAMVPVPDAVKLVLLAMQMIRSTAFLAKEENSSLVLNAKESAKLIA